MLNSLIRFSLSHRGLILALAALIIYFGVRKSLELPVEVLPDLTKPTVTILTESPGYAPEEVETLVTIPLENSLMGVTGITRLRTITDISLSLTYIEFDWDTDIYQARQFVQERLASSSEFLPEGVTPYMTPASSLMGEVMLVGLTDPTGQTSPRDLRTLADWSVIRQLKSIPGIAEVLAMGGGVKQLEIQPQPDRMLALGVTFKEIRKAAAEAVSNTTGGFITSQSKEIMVRNLAMSSDFETIGSVVVRHENDRPVRIKDVATLEWGIEPMRGDAAANGHSGVILSITKSPGFDTIRLTEQIDSMLESIQDSLPQGALITPIYRQADFINLSIGNLKEAIIDGAIMVVIVLFLFLINARITLITLTAIPLSLFTTISVFELLDLSVNSMTLGGLAVAIGMVVDDAIVDVENVHRRLRENVQLENPLPRIEVIASASREVRSSIFYATLLIILVFIPLLGLTGVEGRLFAPIALATIISMVASFIVSLTVIPVLSSFLLNPKPGQKQSDTIFVRILKKASRATWIRFSLSQPFLVLGLALAAIITGAVIFPQMGKDFLPAFREPTVLVATTTAPGTSLQQTNEISSAADALLLEIPEVEKVGRRVGRAEKGDHVVPVSTVEFDIEFHDRGRPRDEIIEDIRQRMRSLPGTFSAMSTPLGDRIGHMLSGVSAPIAIKLYGPDLDELRSLGLKIRDIAREIPGLEEAKVEQQASVPQLRIEIDHERALAYGITPKDLNDELSTLIGGEKVSEISENQTLYGLVLRLPEEWRSSREKIANLPIDTLSGQHVLLKDIAQIRQAKGPNTILRENTQRRFVVSINPTEKDLVTLIETLKEQVDARISLPAGYSISYEGAYEAQKIASQRIITMSLVVLLIIAFLLYSYFKSLSFTLQVMLDIPIALVGGILLTRYTLDNVSIATLVGFIAVAGIAARNSIMMISHYLHLMAHEGEVFGKDLIIRGTLERLVPVLMTALSAGIALVPIALATDAPGKEILNPVAIVIIGGLISSTTLGLIVTPAVYFLLGKKPSERAVLLKASATH